MSDHTAVECKHDWAPMQVPEIRSEVCVKCGVERKVLRLTASPIEGQLQVIAEKLDRIAGYLSILARTADEEREWKEVLGILRNCDLTALGAFLTDRGIIKALRGK